MLQPQFHTFAAKKAERSPNVARVSSHSLANGHGGWDASIHQRVKGFEATSPR